MVQSWASVRCWVDGNGMGVVPDGLQVLVHSIGVHHERVLRRRKLSTVRLCRALICLHRGIRNALQNICEWVSRGATSSEVAENVILTK